MTTRKSVISIDVQDGPFKAFAAAFEKYRGSLNQAKKDSEELQAATKKAAEAEATAMAARKKAAESKSKDDKAAAAVARDAAAAAALELAALKKKGDEEKKAAANKAKVRADDVTSAKELAKWTGDIAKNLASGAVSLGKWLTFGAIASGFGLGGLASNASSTRRQAQGYGISTGDLRAAGVNFGRYINPEGALSNIANLKDSNDSWAFNRVGVNTKGRNAADILPEYLVKAVEAFKAGGQNTSYAEGTGLTKIVSAEELRALASLSKEELAGAVKSFQSDRGAFANDDATSRGWQDFLVSLHRASQGIEVSLIKNLQTLTPYLTRFAEGISKAINAFVSSGQLQDWIKAVGEGLKNLGTFLGSKEFRDDVSTFMYAIHTMATYLGKLFPKSEAARETAAGTVSSMPAAGTGTGTTGEKFKAAMAVYGAIWDHLRGNVPLAERNHNPGNLRIPGSTTGFQSFATDDDGIRGLGSQLQLYENRDKLQTIRGIISKYAPSNENDTAAYIADVTKRTGLGADQQLDPNDKDQLAKLIVAITKHENGRSNFTPGGVRIAIDNTTGGNAQVNVAGLAGN